MTTTDTKTCDVCGATFTRNPSYDPSQWARARYCSRACLGVANHDINLGRGMKGTRTLDQLRADLARSFKDAGVPYGTCQCGCGEPTTIAKQTHTLWGHVNGEPIRFRKGHATKQLTTAHPHRWRAKARTRQMVTGGVPGTPEPERVD